jgi:ABC-type glycerol-3-phosphate transport system substrate-binding protein
MSRHYRKATAFTLVAVIGLATAACSSSASKGGSTGNPADGVADGKPLDPNATVTISIDGAPGADQALNKATYADDVANFKILYPNVTIDPKPYVGQVEDPSQFTAALKAHGETGAFHAYFTDKGQVLDSGDAVDITKYVNDQTVPGFSTLLPGVQQNMKDGNSVYSLPINYYNSGLIYNRDCSRRPDWTRTSRRRPGTRSRPTPRRSPRWATASPATRTTAAATPAAGTSPPSSTASAAR